MDVRTLYGNILYGTKAQTFRLWYTDHKIAYRADCEILRTARNYIQRLLCLRLGWIVTYVVLVSLRRKNDAYVLDDMAHSSSQHLRRSKTQRGKLYSHLKLLKCSSIIYTRQKWQLNGIHIVLRSYWNRPDKHYLISIYSYVELVLHVYLHYTSLYFSIQCSFILKSNGVLQI